MSLGLRITVLVEDTVYQSGLLAEHGLSFWIEYEGHNILFDTGQTDILLHNARALGIDIASVDAVVLSHGHYDHTGGLAAVLGLSPQVPVYCHSQSLEPKYHIDDSTPRNVGTPSVVKERLLLVECQGQLTYTDQITEIVPGVSATGTIPRKHAFEQPPRGFYLDREGQTPDLIDDDQALFYNTDQGVVIVLGCAHAGVVNTLDYIQQRVEDRCIYAVIGGMHLLGAGPDRLSETLASFQRMNIQTIAPGHCTGPYAIAHFNDTLSNRCVPCSTGVIIDL
ncbi:MBL fold metallo-hydrolase [Planctomycetota bacterium]